MFQINVIVISRMSSVMFKDVPVQLGMKINKMRFPPLAFVQDVYQRLQVNGAVIPLFQLTFIRPTVTPEHICICWDDITSGKPIAPICLQIFIPVVHPGMRLELRDAVPLDEEEFGLPSQHGARISGEKTSDGVQMQTWTIHVCAQEMIRRSAANDATDKAVTFKVLSLPGYPSENRQSVIHTQPLVEDHVEVKSLKCLFQHASIITHTVNDDTNSSGISVEFVPV